jgi:CelD/BcsL family acetyltransferase involved in cellulose biosynthesis
VKEDLVMPLATVKWRKLPAHALVDDAELRLEWDRLNAANGLVPVLTADMVCAALEALANGSECLLIGRTDQIVVAMIIMTPKGLRWSTFQPSQLPLGAMVISRRSALARISDSLMRGPLSPALVLSITQVDPLVVEREPNGPDLRSDDYISTGWIDIASDFETYWAARGKNLRQNMRKQRNRLAADGIAVGMHTWRLPEQIAPALARYGALESRGWKEAQGTAVHEENRQGRFYRLLFETAARRGEALIYEYLFDTRTVAMNLCIHRGGTLVILKTTYDESFRPLSPAFMLHEDQLRSIYASGEFQRVEYFGRLMDWHTKWTESSRTLFHVTCYRWALLRWLAERRRRPAALVADADVSPKTGATA